MLSKRLLALTAAFFVALSLGVALLLLSFGVNQPVIDAADALAPGVLGRMLVGLTAPAAPNTPDKGEARQRVELIIAEAPEYAPFFARLRETYTAEYEAALAQFAEQLAESKEDLSADYFLSEAMRRLRQAHGAKAAKGEAQPIAAVFEKQLEVLRAAAQEDSHMCVAFLYGATNADFQRFASSRRALVGAMALAGLDAIVNGQAKAIKRDPPTEADFKVLETALAGRGLGQVEIDALLDGKQPDPPLDDARMCGAGQTYFEVLKTLPEPARTKVYGLALELMAKS